jgi:hypothetical protein
MKPCRPPVLLLFLFQVSLLVNPRPAAAQAAQAGEAELEAAARAFLAEMAGGQWEKAAARFDETMTRVMPAPKVAETWKSLTAQLGEFRRVIGARRADARGFPAVVLTCQFERATLDTRVVFDAAGRIAGLWFSPPQAAVPWTPPAYARPDAFEERAVTIGTAPWQLPATLTMPKGKGPFPAVVLVHGSGPHDEDESIGPNKPFKDLAWGLASRGIVVLRYVKRTKKYPQEVMRAFPTLTVREETEDDAALAVALLASQPGVDRKRIYLAGHSLGAVLAPRIARSHRDIAGILLLAGTTRPLEQVVLQQVKYLTALDGNVTEAEKKQIDAAEQFAREVRRADLQPHEKLSMLGSTVPGAYFLDLRAYQPADVAAGLKLPVLVLQGERDYQVTMADFDGWKKGLAKKKNAAFKSYPALNHLFIAGSGTPAPAEYNTPGHVAEEVLADIARWIQRKGRL